MKKQLLFLMLTLAGVALWAQSTVATYPTLSINNGTSVITFQLQTTSNIKVTNFTCGTTTGTHNVQVWYRPGGVGTGTPNISVAGGWILHETVSVTSTSTTIPTAFSLNTPLPLASGTYGFAIGSGSSTRYMTYNSSFPSVFTDGTVTLNVGPGYGFAGGIPTPSIANRCFVGSVTYELQGGGPNDAGVTDIIEPVSGCDGSSQNIKVEIENFGNNQINNVMIHHSINSIAQTPVLYSQTLDTANGTGPNTAIVTIGSITLTGGLSYNIVAWTELPNFITDTVNANDTSTVTIQGYNYPTVNLGADTTTCPNDPITLNAGTGRDSVRWSTNATTQTIVANTAQNYSVTVWKNGCSGTDNILISFFPAPPTVDLGNDTMICYGDSLILDATTPGVTYLWHDNTTGPTHVADTIGNYSVVIEDANTCKSTDNINISLFSKPLISMNVIPRNTLCYGAPFEFRANSFTQGSTMYQWKINTVNSGPPTTNNKFSPSLMYGDSVNVELLTDVCSSTTFAVPSNYITMYLKPEPKLISGSNVTDTVLENTSKNYLIPVVTGSTFTWTAIGGTIGSPVGNAVKVDWGSEMDTAKIMVTEKDQGNCSYTNVRNVVIISIVGVKEENKTIGIGYAYPNPANTTVTIPLIIDGNWDIDLSLYDMTGKKVKAIYRGEVSGNREVTLAVDDLQNGMYFYKIVTSDGFESVKKLSIKH